MHQVASLSPFLFSLVTDLLLEVIFADDIVICSESWEQVDKNLEMCTRCVCVNKINEREASGKARMQGAEVKKVQEFRYLSSTVQSNKKWREDVKKREQDWVEQTVWSYQ